MSMCLVHLVIAERIYLVYVPSNKWQEYISEMRTADGYIMYDAAPHRFEVGQPWSRQRDSSYLRGSSALLNFNICRTACCSVCCVMYCDVLPESRNIGIRIYGYR
jgi:hypothetical protein